MFDLPRIQIALGIRPGGIVELVIKAEVYPSTPKQIQELCRTEMLANITEMIDRALEYNATFFVNQPPKICLNKNEIAVTSAVIFKDDKNMNMFLREVH
ncbi:MAG: hypothetical protein PHP54_02930 [Clostridia bacterium]|nr:hypothetical protein [Clostridia bacterium]